MCILSISLMGFHWMVSLFLLSGACVSFSFSICPASSWYHSFVSMAGRDHCVTDVEGAACELELCNVEVDNSRNIQ